MRNNILILIGFWLFSCIAQSAPLQNWSTWVADVRKEALSQGISPDVFDNAFSNVHEPNRLIKSLLRSQPEHRLSYYKYRNSRVDSYRIAIGRKKYTTYQPLLESISKDFG